MRHNMKVNHLIISSGWGGLEQYVLDLSRHLVHDGIEVGMVAADWPGITARFTAAGIPVATAPYRKFIDLRTPRVIADMIPHDRPTVLHVHNFREATHAILARKLSPNPDVAIVVTRHMIKPSSNHALNNWIYRSIDAVIFVSDIARRAFLSTDPRIDRDKLTVIHNGINMPDTATRMPDDGFRHIMYHGRLHEYKGVDTVLRAMAIARPPHTRLDILGTGAPEYVDYLKNLSRELGIDDVTDFLGFSENVHPCIERCSLGICPARYPEPFGLATVEYMAHGKTVITTDNGAAPEFITHGENGFLVKPDDPEAVARLISAVLSDEDLSRRIGAAARRSYDAGYTFEAFTHRVEEVYAAALGRRRK